MLSEAYDRMSHGKDGSKFLGFDIIKYQTALIIQDLWLKARLKRLAQTYRMSMIKGLIARQNLENYTYQKITRHQAKAQDHKTMQEFNKIMQMYHSKPSKPYQKETSTKKNSLSKLDRGKQMDQKTIKVKTAHANIPNDVYFHRFRDIFNASSLASQST